MSESQLLPMHPAVARTTRRAIFFVLLVSILTFSVASDRLSRHLSIQLANDQARLLAVAFHAADADNLSSAVDRIRSQTDRLVAVVTLDQAGGIAHAFPDEYAVRQAAEAAARTQGPLAASVNVRGKQLLAWGVAETIRVGPESTKIPVVFLLKRHSHVAGWALVSTICTAGLTLFAFGAVRALTSWFERRIVRPLRGLAGIARGVSVEDSGVSLGGWQETEGIATRIDELVRAVEESQARSERLARAKQWEMRKKEQGFHTELRRAKNQATTDALTQLRNRAFLKENLEVMIKELRAGNDDLSMVMFDVDNFKHHNDTQGHQSGDELLQFIGELLRGAIRPTDHAIRYGGDEFMLLLPGADERQAVAIADRIVKLFAQYTSRIQSAKPLSMSAGVASLTACDVDDGVVLIAAADDALYQAKARGKNAVAAHSETVRSSSPSPALIGAVR